MKIWISILMGLLAATAVPAQASSLKPELSGLDFLVGHWSAPTHNKVEDTGGSSTGVISFTPEVGGSVLLRKDHVNLYDKSGKATGSFDIIMMIYPEAGTIHADYSDGQHIIHYTSAVVSPGHSVTFTSASSPSAPTFKLSFALGTPQKLEINFSMAPPGSPDFHPIATGSAQKDG